MCAPEFKKLYHKRKQCLHEERANILHAKEIALLHLQEKAIKEKEKLTNDLMLFGLWKSESNFGDGLARLKTKKEKLEALKTQLNFHKKF